jgi:hypothetical protein
MRTWTGGEEGAWVAPLAGRVAGGTDPARGKAAGGRRAGDRMAGARVAGAGGGTASARAGGAGTGLEAGDRWAGGGTTGSGDTTVLVGVTGTVGLTASVGMAGPACTSRASAGSPSPAGTTVWRGVTGLGDPGSGGTGTGSTVADAGSTDGTRLASDPARPAWAGGSTPGRVGAVVPARGREAGALAGAGVAGSAGTAALPSEDVASGSGCAWVAWVGSCTERGCPSRVSSSRPALGRGGSARGWVRGTGAAAGTYNGSTGPPRAGASGC